MPRLILASASPRRRELLAGLGLKFGVVAPNIDEAPEPGEAPEEVVRRLSLAKARAVAERHPEAAVIAADTTVVLAGTMFGKPADSLENRRFLEALSGRTHHVHTGHVVVYGGQEVAEVVTTAVCFRALNDDEVDWYVATGEGLDKAGGYGIQGYGAALVRAVKGCYFSVVGLSVAQVIESARRLGVELVRFG